MAYQHKILVVVAPAAFPWTLYTFPALGQESAFFKLVTYNLVLKLTYF